MSSTGFFAIAFHPALYSLVVTDIINIFKPIFYLSLGQLFSPRTLCPYGPFPPFPVFRTDTTFLCEKVTSYQIPFPLILILLSLCVQLLLFITQLLQE